MIEALMSGDIKLAIAQLLLTLPIVFLSLSVHETAHGYVAYKLGDPTARNLGRLTLNPIKHLDLFGTLCMVLFGFGWAKPVPINTRYFIAQSMLSRVLVVTREETRLMSCAVGRSLRTNTLYSDRSSFGT